VAPQKLAREEVRAGVFKLRNRFIDRVCKERDLNPACPWRLLRFRPAVCMQWP